jgi:hypothetical protein
MRLFLTGAFLCDINRTNPLGMKGELAEGFAGLMALLWHVSGGGTQWLAVMGVQCCLYLTSKQQGLFTF